MTVRTLRLLLTGGGTGGHLYPALAATQALRTRPSLKVEAFHAGTASPLEHQILEDAGIEAQAFSLGGLRGTNPVELAWHALKIVAAIGPAMRLIDRFRPDAVLATGGYVTVPVAIAAAIRRKPILLFSADVAAGLAIRTIARLATRIAVPVEQAAAKLPAGKVVVTGYPVRPDLLSLPSREAAKTALGFDPGRPLVLCFGGSQGAHTLNIAIRDGLDALLPRSQVLHLSGNADSAELAKLQTADYRVMAYLAEMPQALAAADLVVCRAGASTLGELPAAGRPAILVPYPYAGGHQKYNAEVLTQTGAAILMDNEAVDDELVPLLLELLADKPRRERMAEAMRLHARPDAAANLASALEEIAA